MKSFTYLALLAAVAFTAAACDTVAGAGQDTSAVGHAVTRGADSAKTY